MGSDYIKLAVFYAEREIISVYVTFYYMYQINSNTYTNSRVCNKATTMATRCCSRVVLVLCLFYS